MRFACGTILSAETVNPAVGTVYSDPIETFLAFSIGVASDIAKATTTFTVAPQETFAAAAATVDSETDLFTKSTHGLITGLPGQLTGANIPAPLALLTNYYIIVNNANSFKIASSEANAFAGTAIALDAPEYNIVVQDTFAASTTAETDWTVATTQVADVAHGFITGLKGQFTTDDTLPAGLSLLTDYYIIKISDDIYSVAASEADAYAGTFVVIADDGTGNHTFTPNTVFADSVFHPADVTTGTDVIAVAAHGYISGLKVRINNATAYNLPVPLAELTDYFVIDNAAGEIKLAASYADALAGTAIDITTVGSDFSTAVTFTPSVLHYGDKAFTDADVDAGTDEIGIASHGYLTGLKVQLDSDTDVYPGALAASTNYYVIDAGAGVIQLAASYSDALAGTQIDITDSGNVPSTVTTLQYTLEQPGVTRVEDLTFFDYPSSSVTTTTNTRELFVEKDCLPFTYARLKHVTSGGTVTITDSFHKKAV